MLSYARQLLQRLLPRREAEAGGGPRRVAVARHRDPLPRGIWPKLVLLGRWTAANLATATACLGVTAFSLGFVQFLLGSDYFRVHHWEVTGLDRLQRHAVDAALEQAVGESPNILCLRTEAVQARLAALPETGSVRLRRDWPDKATIGIRERRPSGILVGSGGNLLVDEKGFLFANATTAEMRDKSLPLLTTDGPPGKVGESLPESFCRKAFLYVRTLQESGCLLARQVAELHHNPESGLTLVFTGGARFVCGNREPYETLPLVEAVRAQVGDFAKVEWADLRTHGHLALRMASDPNAPSSDKDKKKIKMVAIQEPAKGAHR